MKTTRRSFIKGIAGFMVALPALLAAKPKEPRSVTTENLCDGSLTHARITGLTPEKIEELADGGYMEAAFKYRRLMMDRLEKGQR